MTPPAAGQAALSIPIAAAALPGRPGTTSADTLTASSVAITGSAGTDNQYHAGDTITPTVTFSTAVAGHSSASRAIDVGGVDRSATLDSTAAGATTLAFNYVVTDSDRDTDGITVASGALAGTYTHSGHSGTAHTNPTIATALTTAQASHRVNVNTTDYDTDNNGLIEINSLEQLNAARCAAAFPARSHSRGCPDTDDADTNPGPRLGCALTRDLDFDDGPPATAPTTPITTATPAGRPSPTAVRVTAASLRATATPSPTCTSTCPPLLPAMAAMRPGSAG